MAGITRRQFLAAGAALALAGCADQADAPTGSESPASPEPAGHSLTMRLRYNAGTGFEWFAHEWPEDACPLRRVSWTTESEYEGDEPISGGPLADVIVYEPAGEGEACLLFWCARQWEIEFDPTVDDADEALEGWEHYELVASVAADGTIEVTQEPEVWNGQAIVA